MTEDEKLKLFFSGMALMALCIGLAGLYKSWAIGERIVYDGMDMLILGLVPALGILIIKIKERLR